MSKADVLFKETCRKILREGSTTMGQKVRPHWEDGTEAYTKKYFGLTNIYDLREEFPLLTLRPINFKAAVDEILWIFQKKSNNINELNSHIWDQWADDSGSIGTAYGYQIGQRYLHHIAPELTINDIRNLKKEYPSISFKYQLYPDTKDDKIHHNVSVYMDQIDAVIYDLKNNPFSRSIVTNIFNMRDLHSMYLKPCCWSCTFNVTDEGGPKLVLNMQLEQRSNDIMVANNWNVVQYSALLMMLAQVCDMVPGKLMHSIVDAHIYDRHIPIAKNVIRRVEHNAPTIVLDSSITNFYEFTTDSFRVSNYVTGPKIGKLPVAI